MTARNRQRAPKAPPGKGGAASVPKPAPKPNPAPRQKAAAPKPAPKPNPAPRQKAAAPIADLVVMTGGTAAEGGTATMDAPVPVQHGKTEFTRHRRITWSAPRRTGKPDGAA